MNSIDFKIEQNTESTWSFILENNENQIKIWASEFMDPIGSLFYELRLLLKKGQNKPVLYFELRHKGKAINPIRWLKS